ETTSTRATAHAHVPRVAPLAPGSTKTADLSVPLDAAQRCFKFRAGQLLDATRATKQAKTARAGLMQVTIRILDVFQHALLLDGDYMMIVLF
uniref:Uncharacterized protein n=1 Tax=Aegilops tauschii subsp. strangulata TaxID=200361 RepID=A0A453PMM4_AEGTS